MVVQATVLDGVSCQEAGRLLGTLSRQVPNTLSGFRRASASAELPGLAPAAFAHRSEPVTRAR